METYLKGELRGEIKDQFERNYKGIRRVSEISFERTGELLEQNFKNI